MAAEVIRIGSRLCPVRIVSPFGVVGNHVGAVANAEQQGAARAVGEFMKLAGRVHHEGAWRHVDGLARRAHRAAAFNAEIDLGCMRMAVVGADLARLPARDGHVARADALENFLDMASGILFLLLPQAEHVHEGASSLLAEPGRCRSVGQVSRSAARRVAIGYQVATAFAATHFESADNFTKTRHAFAVLRCRFVKTKSLNTRT